MPRGDLDEIRSYVVSLSRGALRSDQIRHQMAVAAVKQLSLSAATGVTEGRLRFNLVNGWVAQKLLFEHGLRRKPVSLSGSG